MFEIKVRDEFDSAHFLEGTGTKCDNLHGHRWTVWVTLSSKELSSKGWVINFAVVKKWLRVILEEFDHNVLNYYLDQPTAENLCYVIFRHLHRMLYWYNCNNHMEVDIEKVELLETPGNVASYSCSDIDVNRESHRRGSRKFYRSDKSKNVRKKLSESMSALWEDGERRKSQIESIKDGLDVFWESDRASGLRKQMGLVSVKNWEDPKIRKKILEGMAKTYREHPEIGEERSKRMKANNPMKNRRNVEKMIASLRKLQKLSPNKEEQKIIEFMKRNTLAFLFVGDGSYIVDGKIPDFVNKSKRIVVEYNNRFWHCNDNPWYDVNDDSEERRKFFEERGYKFYIIWSDEFEKNEEKIKIDLERLLRMKGG